MPPRKHGLKPVINRQTKVLILGSFPSEQSLEKHRYFANPQNHFWRIIMSVIGKESPLGYQKRIELLKKNKIGLWDVVASCQRKGSQDTKIRNPKINDFKKLLKAYSNLRAIFIAGKKAGELFAKHYSDIKIPHKYLPSTSPANAKPIAAKISAWKIIKKYL
jgi:hypoxanthine-DNA glycosylase